MWNSDNHRQFHQCIKDLLDTPEVISMSEIPQHVNVNCLDHSIYVSYISFLLCRFMGLDFISGARGGLLHDLFLYDWRKENSYKKSHLFSHPNVALENASNLCDLTDIEKDIIQKHMWPLTLKAPKYKESFVVSCADKFCAIVEALFIYKALNIGSKLEIPRCTA